MYLGPDESDKEEDDGDEDDNEDCNMISVVKISKDELKVNGVLGLEESRPIAGEMVGLTLSPDPHIILEHHLARGRLKITVLNGK